MKRTLIILFILITAFASCDKWPLNSTLEGQWQILSIERGVDKRDVKNEKRFWNLQLHVLMLERYMDQDEFFAHFHYRNDSIVLSDICFPSNNETSANDNVLMTQEDIESNLTPYGIDVLNEGFRVLQLSDRTMMLQHGDKVITFVKR